MTGPTSPTDRAACLNLAQRQVGDVADWTPVQWTDQLAEDSLLAGDPQAQYFRPYRTALAYLLRPGQVKQRSEGPISEQYADVAATASRLREMDLEWVALRLPQAAEDGASGGSFDGAIDWGHW